MTQQNEEFPYLDAEEERIMEAYLRDEFVLSENQEEWRAALREASKRPPIIQSSLEVSLPERDRQFIVQQAQDAGVAPEVLASHVLHRYVKGQLGDAH